MNNISMINRLEPIKIGHIRIKKSKNKKLFSPSKSLDINPLLLKLKISYFFSTFFSIRLAFSFFNHKTINMISISNDFEFIDYWSLRNLLYLQFWEGKATGNVRDCDKIFKTVLKLCEIFERIKWTRKIAKMFDEKKKDQLIFFVFWWKFGKKLILFLKNST